MNKIICPKCERVRKFSLNEQGKYECKSCKKSFKQCKSQNCLNLVNHGPICKKCIGKGMKNGGTVAATGLLAVGVTAYKILKR